MKVVMMGATGAVGGEVLKTLLEMEAVTQITSLGRKPAEAVEAPHLHQHIIDIFEPDSYKELLADHDVAICTLGEGLTSQVSREDFMKIAKQAPLGFARECKKVGMKHFELLSSVGIEHETSGFYFETKEQLVGEVINLDFYRFSVVQPSVILDPTNRDGFWQGVLYNWWPKLNSLFSGRLKQFRGVKVEVLGRAMAMNILTDYRGQQYLKWEDFQELAKR